MSGKAAGLIASILFSGILTYMITTFFAGGTIAENYSDDQYPAPEFFINFVLWGIGIVFALLYGAKQKNVFYYSALGFLWLSAPFGTFIVLTAIG